MKRLISLLIVGLMTLGCSENISLDWASYPSFKPHTLRILDQDLNFKSTQNVVPMEIIAESTPWVIQNDIEWLTSDITSGDSNAEVMLTAQANPLGDEQRVGIFYVASKASDFPISIPIGVIQYGGTPYIKLPVYSVTLSSQEPTYRMTVDANCSWTTTCSATWLQVTREGDDIVLTATEPNSSNYSRTANVEFAHKGDDPRYINLKVQQLPSSVISSIETIEATHEGGVYTVELTTEYPWTVSSNDSYVNVTPKSGDAGTTKLTVEIAPNTTANSRETALTISLNGTARSSINIKQSGLKIRISPYEMKVAVNGGEREFTVDSNTEWELTKDVDWITLSATSGKNSQDIKLTATPNLGNTSRIGYVTAKVKGTTLSYVMKVLQSANSQEVDMKSFEFGPEGGSASVSIQSATGWNASTKDSWITLSPLSATTNQKLNISVAANANPEERTGTIELKMGDKTETLTVVQSGSLFELTTTTLTFSSKGKTLPVSITANNEWNAKIADNSSWLSLDVTYGQSSGTIKVTCTDNPTVTERTSALEIWNSFGQRLRLPIIQNGRYLRLDHTELIFFFNGGKSDAVQVETDGTFAVSTPNDWLTVTKATNSFTVTATQNNSDVPRTGKVIVELTGLTSGSYQVELPVTQLESGGSFHGVDYGNDKNYDGEDTRALSIDLKDYKNETNYDSSSGQSVMKLAVRKLPTQLKVEAATPTIHEIK